MGAAMLNMATSAAGIRTQNRVGVGVGYQSGATALSIGYQRAISDRAALTNRGAFRGQESSLSVGAALGWLGRDSDPTCLHTDTEQRTVLRMDEHVRTRAIQQYQVYKHHIKK